jgi:carbonic anhydrase
MTYQTIKKRLAMTPDWATRRQKKIPNNKKLFVLACMDERLPVLKALEIEYGDAHIFRNAGGLVTDDAIRSAMFSTHFSQTEEIIIINHTDCGLTTSTTEQVVETLQKEGIDLDAVTLDPALPELTLAPGAFGKWVKMFKNVDEICKQQVEYLKNHPLIPKDVKVHGYIFDVATMSLRRPH